LICKTPYLWGELLTKTNCNFNGMRCHCLLRTFRCLPLIFLLSLKLMAQKDLFPFPAFEKITTRNGLSGNTVHRILQDRQGFLWFITGSGLNRFDGYDFKAYGYDPSDSNSITLGLFYSLVQDKNGVLWMNSENDGIYSFDPQKEKYVNRRK